MTNKRKCSIINDGNESGQIEDPLDLTIPESLEKHMRIHTGEKSYSCPGYQRNFNSKENLEKRMRTTHTDMKLYMRYMRFEVQSRQQAEDTSSNRYRRETIQLRCMQKGFTTLHKMKHIDEYYSIAMHAQYEKTSTNTITGKKPFECDVSGKKFNQNSNLLAKS
ncbi:hypothetical protein DINM_000260 [Dirofilaria immitis]|nr:hypothetical protein [Dirofilaria immitis]